LTETQNAAFFVFSAQLGWFFLVITIFLIYTGIIKGDALNRVVSVCLAGLNLALFLIFTITVHFGIIGAIGVLYAIFFFFVTIMAAILLGASAKITAMILAALAFAIPTMFGTMDAWCGMHAVSAFC
jgi:hypothetical protein